MSYKLKAYRVAGGATCPEAIISCLLLYAIRYIFKHVSRDGSVTANELHEILHAMKPRKALLRFLSKLSMSSLHLLMPPRAAYATHSMGPASLRDALALSTCRSLLPIAVAISFLSRLDSLGLHRKTTLSVTGNAFAPTTLPTLPTSFPTFVPLAGPLT